MKINEILESADNSQYFMEEGCAVFALTLHARLGKGKFFVLADPSEYADKWDNRYEYTHVVLAIDGQAYDVTGKTSLEKCKKYFHKDTLTILGPYDEKQFTAKYVGNDDRKPFYAPDSETIDWATTIINKNPAKFGIKKTKITEETHPTLYHGSRKKFPIGFTLKPQSDGYVAAGSGDEITDSDLRTLEAYIEKYRPKDMIPRLQAVFMCHSIEDIDYAGGYEDFIYRVKPIGQVDKHDLSWYSHIQSLMGGDDENTPEIQKQIANAALNYWKGVPYTDRNSSLWEYLAHSAKIISIEDVDNT